MTATPSRTLPLLAFSALALGACAAPSLDRAEALPPAPTVFAAAEDAAPPAGDWLAAFDDPVLPLLTAEALTHNADFRAAAARLDQARASARVAGAPRLPSLDASGSVTERDSSAFPSSTTSYALGLNASWEADVWGRVAATAGAAAYDAEASEADYQGARLSLAGATAQAWFALIEAELQEALAARDVGNRERSLDFIERRYRSGVNTSLDVRLARSALATSRATLQLRRQTLGEAQRTLEVLLGRYPAAELAGAADLPDLAPLAGAGAPADLLWRRPDMIAADLRLESAGLRAEAARDALLPRLTLQAGANATSANTANLLDADSIITSLVAGLAQPVFRGGALRGEADRAEAAARERLASYASSALTAWREAENALAAEDRLAERAGQLRVAYEEAARAEELAERQYRNGLVTIFNLLDAQARRITSESQYIGARRERAANRVRLYLAIGGEFAAPTDFADLSAQEPAL